MNDMIDTFLKLIKKYPFALIQVTVCILVLFIIFLVFEDIPPSWHDHIVSLIIYIVGIALLTQIRLEITVFQNTKAIAENREARGISDKAFWIIIFFYAIWFVFLVAYNIYRGILAFV